MRPPAKGAPEASASWIHTSAPKWRAKRSASATSSRWVSSTWRTPPLSSMARTSGVAKRGESTSRLPSGRAARKAFAPNESSELNPQ